MISVRQLREQLAELPDELEVVVALPADGSGGGADSEYWEFAEVTQGLHHSDYGAHGLVGPVAIIEPENKL